MPDLTLLSILALFVAAFYVFLSAIPIVNARGNEALFGVVNGVPASAKTRRLILFNDYLPLCVFMAAFLLVVGLGAFELTGEAEDPGAKAVGYIGAVMAVAGAVIWTANVVATVHYISSVVRETERQ